MIELDIGLICVCMPSFRVLLIKVISHFQSEITDSNTSQKRFSVNPNLMLKVEGDLTWWPKSFPKVLDSVPPCSSPVHVHYM